MIGKVDKFTPPKINQVAPKDRENRWHLVSGIKSPFPGDLPAREFGFWFNYFWAEIVDLHGITAVQQQKAAEVFFSVFDETTPPPYTVRADFARRDDAFKENALRQLLLIGFKRVALEPPRTAPRAGAPLAPPPLTVADGRHMNLFHLDGKRGPVDIAFRADARCYEDLCQHKGFRTRARSEDSPIHSIYGLDKAWNPFNNPVYRNSLFLRLGSKNADNCLQTVISIGAEFAGITHFPILNDVVLVFQAKSPEDGRFLAYKPLDEWKDADEQAARNHSQRVRAVRDPRTREIDHLEKDNYIYAFHMAGVKVFNTQEFFTRGGHTPFPERGAAEIPLENLLAEIHFVQKWFFSPDRGQIFLYEVAFDPIRWVPSQAYVEVVIGAEGRAELEKKIQSEIARARNRPEFTIEMNKYRQLVAGKATRLTAEERKAVLSAFKNYRGRPVTKDEKAALCLALPLLKDKINAVSTLDWSEMRKESKK